MSESAEQASEHIAELLKYTNTTRRAALDAAISRRALLRGVAVGGAAIAGARLLAACGVAPANKTVPESEAVGHAAATDYSTTEKLVNFSNWPAYIDVSDSNANDHPTLDEFTKQTGIKVNYVEEINDNNDFYTKIDPMLAAGKDTDRDVIVLSDFMIPKLRELNYIQELDARNVPNRANMLPAMLNDPVDPGRKFSMPWASGYTTIAYNAKLVPTPITSIKELFTRPDLKGRVSLLAEMEDTVAFALFAIGKSPASFTDTDFANALAYIRKAKDAGQIRQFSGNDYLSDFQQGNTAATMAYSGDVAQLDQPELKTVQLPTEGLLSWSDNMVIPNYARHKANAEKLMNFYYQPDIAAQLSDYVDYIPPVTGAVPALQKLDGDAAGNPLIVPTAQMTAKAKPFKTLTIKQLDSYTQQFQQITGQ
ncbi:MAG TPA: spermidine/putrescine ABC transporter substrate-binding protein [Pseudonocardiaceae bacterium]|jgi:spermidine/putrescine transport system substrate-binding protein|nr:spermidine/putrescine ABC transporter substrate-binding protein [Pseudonocardiaceae bacterium]